MKFSVITFGCRVNQADSFSIAEALQARGAVETTPSGADIVIVNTCSVTASADQGARQTIRRLVRDNPAVQVVVTGCYATRAPEEISSLPNVMKIVPNGQKADLPDQLAFDELTTRERYAGSDGPCGGSLHPGSGDRTALTIRVQTGCDQRCSYCIIPRTRGAGVSKPVTGVVADIRRAVVAGYKEIVVTGVHLGSYGRDLGDGTTLETLVRVLADWPDDVRFRISSLEPMDCSREIVDLVAKSSRLAKHFHLPLQHGSDAMLRSMRRPYSMGFYRALIDDIHARMAEAAIGTDLIVGFPGEESQHFAEMMDGMRTMPFSHLHVFPYSDRPGTEAASMPEKVCGAEIRERARTVREFGASCQKAFQERQIGTCQRGLSVGDGSQAVTGNYLKVDLPRGRPRNEWVDVKIAGIAGALEGIPLVAIA